MTLERREQAYREHLENTDDRGYHVDGCFYCGGNHPTDCCTDSASKDDYWDAAAASEGAKKA